MVAYWSQSTLLLQHHLCWFGPSTSNNKPHSPFLPHLPIHFTLILLFPCCFCHLLLIHLLSLALSHNLSHPSLSLYLSISNVNGVLYGRAIKWVQMQVQMTEMFKRYFSINKSRVRNNLHLNLVKCDLGNFFQKAYFLHILLAVK